MRKFKLKSGSRISGVDPDAVGAELERIDSKYGEITPDVVVSEARPKRSPLHPAFEWDDGKAASEFRLWQARSLVRSIQVVIDDAEPVPAFYHVEISESPNGAYRPSEIVVRNPDMLASAIQGLRQKLAMAANAVELVERQVAELAPRKAKKVRRVRETIQSASRMAAAM